MGSFEVELTDAGARDPLFEEVPRRLWVQLGHNDRVATLAADAQLLAESPAAAEQFRQQAFDILLAGRARGLGLGLRQLVAEMPHGGYKKSGYGKDLSAYALDDYTRVLDIDYANFEALYAINEIWRNRGDEQELSRALETSGRLLAQPGPGMRVPVQTPAGAGAPEATASAAPPEADLYYRLLN